MVIDRINPRGNYCPENCRWITKQENARRVVGDRDKEIDLLKNEILLLQSKILIKTPIDEYIENIKIGGRLGN